MQNVLDFLGKRSDAFGARLRSRGLGLAEGEETPCLRQCVRALEGGPTLALDADGPGVTPPVVDESRCTARFVISTASRDRMGDVVIPRGCLRLLPSNYGRNPRVFLSHATHDLPIGSARNPDGSLAVEVRDDDILSTCAFHMKTPISEVVFDLVAAKELGAASIGFLPVKVALMRKGQSDRPEENELGEDLVYFDEGQPDFPTLRFHEWDLTEWSIVPVPANAECISMHLSRGKVRGLPIPEPLRKALEPWKLPKKTWSPGMDLPAAGTNCGSGHAPGKFDQNPEPASPAEAKDDRRWARSLSKRFDISEEEMRPASAEYDFVSRHLECKIREVYQHSFSVPSAKMGSWLTAWKEVSAPFERADVRNVTHSGAEAPPCYEVIRLNSEKSEDFLVEGLVFYRGPQDLVLSLQPTWYGLACTLYCRQSERAPSLGLVRRAWELAATTYNFLKGEAFSLGGDFLPKTGEGWDDLFLEPANEQALTLTLGQLAEKGAEFANRGTILMGPPGTGKTLSGRVVRNRAAGPEGKATYIWVSARDFYRSGAFGGIRYAFELAKELAPAVLFIEDVDHWLDDYSVDLLKTEMDGVGRHKGVWTCLTTNFPEQMPEALIDRPGRFHDVLQFDLPSDECRSRMFARWLPGLGEADRRPAVERSKGLSGAHVYELCRFALTLAEQDGRGLPAALTDAFRKTEEQRKLIGKVQRRREAAPAFVKSLGSYESGRGFVPVSKETDPAVPGDLSPGERAVFVWDGKSWVRDLDGLVGPPGSPAHSPDDHPGESADSLAGWPPGARLIRGNLDAADRWQGQMREALTTTEQTRVRKHCLKLIAHLDSYKQKASKLAHAVYPDRFEAPQEVNVESELNSPGAEKEVPAPEEAKAVGPDYGAILQVLRELSATQERLGESFFEVTGRRV